MHKENVKRDIPIRVPRFFLVAQGGVGAGAAAEGIVGGREGEPSIEDLADGLLQQLHIALGHGTDVANGFLAEFEHWVVVVGSGMLDRKSVV